MITKVIYERSIEVMGGAVNPEKIRRRLRDANLPEENWELLVAARVKREERARRKPLPQLDAEWRNPRYAAWRKILMERKLEVFRAENKFRKTRIFKSWSKTFQKKVLGFASVDIYYAESEAVAATLECVCRAAKSRGWQVRHKSKNGGRLSSRYIIIPNYGESRLSDHDLPDSPERADRRDNGNGPRWRGEVVITPREACTRGRDYWLRRILLAAAGRL